MTIKASRPAALLCLALIALWHCLVVLPAPLANAQDGGGRPRDQGAQSLRAPVVLDGRELFDVGGTADHPASERAATASGILREQVHTTPAATPIAADRSRQGPWLTLRVGQQHLLTVTAADLAPGVSAEERADQWLAQIRPALVRARQERTAPARRVTLRRLSLTGLAVVALTVLLQWWQRRARRRRSAGQPHRSYGQQAGTLLLQVILWAGFAVACAGMVPELRDLAYNAWALLQRAFTTPLVQLGKVGFSALDITRILVLLGVLYLAVQGITGLLRSQLLRGSGLRPEVQETLVLGFRIALLGLGLLVLLQAVGLDISSLAILLSVVGVGIGFGLQNIARNLISGLIILLERPVQVGDFIRLGELTGTVERVGLRSTQIQTLDHVTIIVPNAELIDGNVVNWSHGNPVSRLRIPLGVAYGSSIPLVRRSVLEVADRHPRVLRYPKPQLWFKGFGDSSLDFDLLVWICEPRLQERIRSDLYYMIETIFRVRGITIPFPQRDLHIRSDTGTQPLLPRQTEPLDMPPTRSTPASPETAEAIDWSEILDLAERPSDAELAELVVRMSGPKGIDRRDRRYGLHLYCNCFVGREATEWLMGDQQATRDEAIRLGRLLVERGVFHHVSDEHDFEDEYLFYRFYAEERTTTAPPHDDRSRTADGRSAPPETEGPAHP